MRGRGGGGGGGRKGGPTLSGAFRNSSASNSSAYFTTCMALTLDDARRNEDTLEVDRQQLPSHAILSKHDQKGANIELDGQGSLAKEEEGGWTRTQQTKSFADSSHTFTIRSSGFMVACQP